MPIPIPSREYICILHASNLLKVSPVALRLLVDNQEQLCIPLGGLPKPELPELLCISKVILHPRYKISFTMAEIRKRYMRRVESVESPAGSPSEMPTMLGHICSSSSASWKLIKVSPRRGYTVISKYGQVTAPPWGTSFNYDIKEILKCIKGKRILNLQT